MRAPFLVATLLAACAVDAEAIAGFFTSTGVLFEPGIFPIVGADSIRAFMGSFPGQPVSEQHGRFVMEWVRQADGRWLIQRYYRVPLPAAPASGA